MEAFHDFGDVGAAAAVPGRIAAGPAGPGAPLAPRQNLGRRDAAAGAAGAGVSTGTGTAGADEDGRTGGCHAGHFWLFFKCFSTILVMVYFELFFVFFSSPYLIYIHHVFTNAVVFGAV